MTFEASLGNGIDVTSGKNDTIAGCIVRNTRQLGVRVVGGSEHRVDGCEIYDTGTGGLVLEGGDRKTLTAAHHEATNNHIHDFSRHQQTSAYGVTLAASATASRTTWSNAPRTRRCSLAGTTTCWSSTSSATSSPRPTTPAQCTRAATRPAAGTSSATTCSPTSAARWAPAPARSTSTTATAATLVIGNVFVRCGDPGGGPFGTIFSHGGHDIRAENNIFVDCKRALGSMPWNDDLWKASLAGAQESYWPRKLLQDVDITKPPYTTRYPELLGFMDPKPGTPRVSRARNNVIVRARK
jgi:hypothetical protein